MSTPVIAISQLVRRHRTGDHDLALLNAVTLASTTRKLRFTLVPGFDTRSGILNAQNGPPFCTNA